jgi:hypothetical protein
VYKSKISQGVSRMSFIREPWFESYWSICYHAFGLRYIPNLLRRILVWCLEIHQYHYTPVLYQFL